jgi:5-carboxymethyl-2-hydroxymuconic-semialdehyde dehydrogenase
MAQTSATFEGNRDKAAHYLARFREAPLGHFINGKAVASHSGKHFANMSPVDNKPLGEVAAGSAQDIDDAAWAAKAAFPAWRDVPAARRRALLHKFADLIEKRAEEIALVESSDTGQPIRFMSAAAARSADNFRFFADRAPGARDGLTLPAEDHINFTLREPIGPVGIITPWNTPFMLSTWKIAPALAAGCTVVHKPAEWSPLTAMLLAEIAIEAGLPPGVLNTVNGLGEEAGKALTEHPDIKAIGFVGESATGSAIMAQGAATLKRVHFELGGKNPVLVFADADLDRALDAVVFMIYSLNGERCTSSSRLLVEHSIARDFETRLAARLAKLKIGHPLAPETEIGPLIHPRHRDKVLSYLDVARSEGVRVLEGAGVSADLSAGNFVKPVAFLGARNDMRVAQEEIFGPCLTVIEFADETEAIALANDVRYGLTGYAWTRDTGRSLRLARKLEAGMIWINSENNRHLPAPFGGMKSSGIGRDGGDYSFDFYMETKNICIALDTHKVPKLGN